MATYYTIQTKEAWDDALTKGFLEFNKKYIYELAFPEYNWMVDQMKKRLPNYNCEYPIWLWLKRPDLRYGGHLEKGLRGVLLEVDIDENDVLLSDFIAWHCVLNNDFLSISEDEENGITNITKEESWERIFDLDLLRQSEYVLENISDVDVIQGVTGKIDIKNIKLIKEFVAK